MKKGVIIVACLMLSLMAKAQTGNYSEEIQAVDEYCPAPGQFINTMPPYEEGDNAQTMAAKCTAYLASDDPYERGTVCLGAYGVRIRTTTENLMIPGMNCRAALMWTVRHL